MTTKDKIDLILVKGYLTGSSAWGLANEHSDKDLVLREVQFKSLKCHLGSAGVRYRHGDSFTDGIKFVWKGQKYDVWPASEPERAGIVECTEEMKKIIESTDVPVFESKPLRVAVFEQLRVHFGVSAR